ncbi:hypothetical protein [Novosphingobium sp.]|uniref:hypothetical protein n=1 Tax=Novosphingobium sp. TaxID=1874826 RepID=UPI00273617D4|nr:hypothetical protein [Novosphingobium sp.]MDP3907490.1 hypothetical protein [Novosphingobium sp.]
MSEPRELLIEGTTTADAMRATGPFFIEQLKEDAEAVDGPPGLKRDWFTVADWLDHKGGPISLDQRLQITEAWIAYISIGVAPSLALQALFDSIAKDLAGEVATRPPAAILDVFDRLLATDDEIKIKRASDLRKERRKLQEAFQGAAFKQPNRFAQKGSRVRKIIFFSAVWALVVHLYAWLFDPLGVGGWEELEQEHFHRLLVISLLPALALLVFGAYRKWVR